MMKLGVALCAVMAVAATVLSSVHAQQPQGTWSKAAPMPGARNEMRAALVNGKIYVIGGNSQTMQDGKAVNVNNAGINQVYDPATDTWRTLAPMPQGSNHPGIAALDGKIYVAGGFEGPGHMRSTDRFYVYDPANDTWRTLPPLSSPRGSPALAALNGRIHAISGRTVNADGALPVHEVYDPAANRWTMAAPIPVGRDHVGIGVVDGKIHIYVGRRTDAIMSKVALHDVYDPATDRWTSAPPMPTAVSSGSFAHYRGMLFYLGGECTDDDRTFDVNEAFDPRTGRWARFAPLPAGRHASAAMTVGDKLYVIGGALGCGATRLTTDTLVFTLP
jgi:N-acetylneuraminic acid mutarotase